MPARFPSPRSPARPRQVVLSEVAVRRLRGARERMGELFQKCYRAAPAELTNEIAECLLALEEAQNEIAKCNWQDAPPVEAAPDDSSDG